MKRSGYSLIELLVYIGVLAILLAVGYVAVERCMGNSWAFRLKLNDQSRAMFAGERWRADVRAASGRIRRETAGADEMLRIPTRRGEIVYRVETNSVLRHFGPGSWSCVLDNVKTSVMEPDQRQSVTAWRWELQLAPRPATPGLTGPLYTFIAVPGSDSKR